VKKKAYIRIVPNRAQILVCQMKKIPVLLIVDFTRVLQAEDMPAFT
jgi:hypothetical protein